MDTSILILSALLCGIGLIISLFAFSGTWLVLLAALIARLSSGVPTIGTLIAFALLCIAVEVIESIAGALGVQKRGGSRLTGAAALIGGLVGMVIGSAAFPIIGTFLGMLLGSFGLAYFVEYQNSGRHEEAAHIARGAVWARLVVLFMKTILTAAMTFWLLAGLLQNLD